MQNDPQVPWYRRAVRWGQTNITEIDPADYDGAWWKGYWRATAAQGVIVNAGGIVAYYPSADPLHHRSPYLSDRDLFGEIVAAARDCGLAVVARMDSNRAHQPLYDAHPDWFAVEGNGKPFRAGDLYVSCVNSPYYDEYIPSLLAEIITRYRPDGFADNSWSGLSRNDICRCDRCARRFRDTQGRDLPAKPDWDDPAYRAWVRWSYRRRLDIWDQNNRVTARHGGTDCLWCGMLSADIGGQSHNCRDLKALCERSVIVFLDHQMRHAMSGFHANAEAGKLIHGLAGAEVLCPESMAMYQGPDPTFRRAARPAPEARLWMMEGFAGGIGPWWHHVGACQEDRRQFETAPPVMQWHRRNEAYLVNRQPVASVGVVWSQENYDFYGRADGEALTVEPYRGWVGALVRARMPYVPLHADHVASRGSALSLLILPNVGLLTDDQAAAVRAFVAAGGSLVVSGEAGICDRDGRRAADSCLSSILGVTAAGAALGSSGRINLDWAHGDRHTYVRLHPELRNGPADRTAGTQRHPVLAGFDKTDILPFGGRLQRIAAGGDTLVACTFVPPFPIYPPETSYMRERDSGLPAVVVREDPSGGRVAYLAADFDRLFYRHNLPDHGDLLANVVRWALGDKRVLDVSGTGLIDCNLYAQDGRMIMHIVNLTSAGSWRTPVHELIDVGPFDVRVRLPAGSSARSVRALVNEAAVPCSFDSGWASFRIERIRDHEVVVVE